MWKSANYHKKPPPLKHILALQTLGQECLHSDTELIEKVNFDLGHPVRWFETILNESNNVPYKFTDFTFSFRICPLVDMSSISRIFNSSIATE